MFRHRVPGSASTSEVELRQWHRRLAPITFCVFSSIPCHLAFVQLVVSDDVAAALADITLGAPVNGTVELAGPERLRLAALVQRFLHVVLSEILGADAKTLPGIHNAVITAYLEHQPENRQIELNMFPADTLQQARAFYERPNIGDRILKLQSDG